MLSFLMFIYIVVCFALIIVVLLQSSKGGGLAGAFGGTGDMGAVFGGRGAAGFLSKLTTILATAFMVLALVISFINRGDPNRSGLVQQEQSKRSTTTSSPASGLPIVPTEEGTSSLPIETGESTTQSDTSQ